MDAGTLHQEIAKVCPIIGARVGIQDDRSTWSFESAAEATKEQIDAGNNVIATIPVNYQPPPQVDPATAALFDHENRLLTLEGKPPITADEFADKVTEIDVKASGIAINKVSNVASG